MEGYVTKLLARDLPEEVFASFNDRLRHEYDAVYNRLSLGRFASCAQQVSELGMLNLAAARLARRENGKRALLGACREFGIPHEVRSLPCNGQVIVLAQVGELLLLPEPMDYLEEKPSPAAYKQELAASHYASRQLEFDFGERFRRPRIDSRNTMLVVLQHGMQAERFDEANLRLSMLRVAIPDSSFTSWTWIANAMNDELSYLMDWMPSQRDTQSSQEDRVQPMLRASVRRLMENEK